MQLDLWCRIKFGWVANLLAIALVGVYAPLSWSKTIGRDNHARAYISVIDSTGRQLYFKKPIEKIVSLLPSLTENICALDQCAKLVGVDNASNYPVSVRGLTDVGSGLNPNVESIVALHPDVVIMGKNARLVSRLTELGIKVVVLSAENLTQLQDVIVTLGQLLQAPMAAKLWVDMKNKIQEAAKIIPPKDKNLRVYFELGEGGYAAGSVSFIGEILTDFGEKNILNAKMGAFPQITPEFILASDPQIIFTASRSAKNLLDRSGWRGISAIKNKRICALTPRDLDLLLRPSLRLSQGAQVLANCITAKTKIQSNKVTTQQSNS